MCREEGQKEGVWQGGTTSATNLLRGIATRRLLAAEYSTYAVFAMKMHARNLYESPNKISEAIVCHNVAQRTCCGPFTAARQISTIHFKRRIYDVICFATSPTISGFHLQENEHSR